MKASNKKRLEKLENLSSKMERKIRRIIYDSKMGPPLEREEGCIYLCLPDNGRRFPSYSASLPSHDEK